MSNNSDTNDIPWWEEMDRACDEEILNQPYVLSCEEFKKVYGYDSEYCKQKQIQDNAR